MKFSSLLTRSVMMSKIQNDAYYTPKEVLPTIRETMCLWQEYKLKINLYS